MTFKEFMEMNTGTPPLFEAVYKGKVFYWPESVNKPKLQDREVEAFEIYSGPQEPFCKVYLK